MDQLLQSVLSAQCSSLSFVTTPVSAETPAGCTGPPPGKEEERKEGNNLVRVYIEMDIERHGATDAARQASRQAGKGKGSTKQGTDAGYPEVHRMTEKKREEKKIKNKKGQRIKTNKRKTDGVQVSSGARETRLTTIHGSIAFHVLICL